MYDIFFLGSAGTSWDILKSKYPNAQRLEKNTDFDNIRKKSFTKLFWIIWDDVVLDAAFNLNEYKATQWDNMYVHVFKNGEHFDGICLFPKNITITKREFHHRFFVEKKEIDIVASIPKQYKKYSPQTFEEYTQIDDEMFWLVSPSVNVTNEKIFDLYFSHHNTYDRRENHVFKSLCDGKEVYLTGVVLCSKYKQISKKEFDNQYIVDKKEHDIVVCKYQYPIYTINNYEEYLTIASNEKEKMFWCVWPEISITDNSIFDFYFLPNYSQYDFDRKENHVFKNLCNDDETYLSGLVLFSKDKIISKKEFNRRYLIDKKEHTSIVSRYRYPKHLINSYEDYLSILENTQHPMFWGIWPEIEITDTSVFDFYYNPNDGKYDFDRKENHTFKHIFNNNETYVNGLVLFSKEKPISLREFTHRFLINRKEHDRVVSKHLLYDVVFISYNESNADENYNKLISKCPRAKRVHGVKGIHQAHIKAVELCNTDMIWIVDGDAVIEDNFNFDLVMSSYDTDCVHVWRSRNPVNNLEYGNGGVKLLPRKLTLEMNTNTTDMTTSISKKFKAMNEVSNTNMFNTDEFTTWRSAFRECCKLSSRVIERQYEEDTQQRLDIWCSEGESKPFGKYAIAGAIAGRMYGTQYKNDLDALKKINDFNWLKEQFDASK